MILPPLITPDQMQQARALVREHRVRQASLGRLTRQLEQARAVRRRSNELLDERLEFKWHPGRLAGLAELYQRNHPVHHPRILRAYRHLLRDMIDPPKPLSLGDGPSLPKPPVHTVNFDTLGLDARCYLLGPYLGIHQNGRFAELDLLRSRPSERHLVIIQSGGPVDIALWRDKLPAINAWLNGGVLPFAWTITAHGANRLVITGQSALPKLVPFTRDYLVPEALFVGIDTTTRQPVYIPFQDLTAGTYIPGTAGSGKTSAMHILLRSIFANLDLFDTVWLCDGKDGVALSRYEEMHPKIRVLYDEPDVWQLAADLTATMKQRNAEQRARGVDKATAGFIAVLIDELPTYIADPPKTQKKEHEAFLDNLSKIAMRGRSAGIRLFLISQTPVKEQIPVTLRANCSTVIAFRLPEQAHATSTFGELKHLPADPRKLPTGQAIVLLSPDTRNCPRDDMRKCPLVE